MSTVSAIDLRPRARRSKPDFILIGITAALSALGLLMILSTSAPRLEAAGLGPQLSDGAAGNLRRVGIGCSGGHIPGFGPCLEDGAAPMFYVGMSVLLLAVLSPIGALRQGAQRWISLGLFDLQPSEVAKVGVILALALMLAPVEDRAR
jgi:cell division protein FtsW (lipid II flippase)